VDVISSPNVRTVLPHRCTVIKDISLDLARPGSSPAPPPVKATGPNSIEFTAKGGLEIKGELVLTQVQAASSGTVTKVPERVELNEDLLKSVFVGDKCGFDRNFRGNVVITTLFLEGYALLLELGSLYSVLKQAKGAAQTGGSLLLYGVANAHFNALLELAERLTDNMRSRLNKIVEIGEARFEQLVDINWATVLRCSWIANYRELPRTLVQVEKNAGEILKHVATARSEANALTLKERKDQAEEETQSFFAAADGLTKRTAKSMNIAYNSYTALEKEEANSMSKIKDSVKESFDKIDEEGKKLDAEAQKKAQEELKHKMVTVDTSKGNQLRQYALTIKTGNRAGSGTDAQVFCVVVGSNAKTDEIALPDADKTRFECGGEDIFDIDVEGDIGDIKELHLGHDNTGNGADWRVKWAELIDKSKGGVKYIFNYEAEIGGKKGKGVKESMFRKPEPKGTDRPGDALHKKH